MKLKCVNKGTYAINLLSGDFIDINEEKEVELNEDEHRVFVVHEKVLKAVESVVEKTKKDKKIKED